MPAKRTGLQANDAYATMIQIGGKTVKAWNEQFSELENEDGENIPAISIAANGTDIVLRTVQSTGIIDVTKNIVLSVSKDFVSETGYILKEDITRYYIPAFKYWSSLEPFEVEQKQANAPTGYSFDLKDSGVNGWLLLTFAESIVDNNAVVVEYGSSPIRQKDSTVPAATGAMADYLASSGLSYNLMTHLYINGKSVYEMYGDARFTANTPVWQIHANADGARTLRIASASEYRRSIPTTISCLSLRPALRLPAARISPMTSCCSIRQKINHSSLFPEISESRELP